MKSVDRLQHSANTMEAVRRHYLPTLTPVVVTDIDIGFDDWSMDGLVSVLGSTRFELADFGPLTRVVGDKRSWNLFSVKTVLPFDRFARLVRDGVHRHTALVMSAIPTPGTPLDDTVASRFMMDLDIGCDPTRATHSQFWATPGGTLSPLHHDETNHGTLMAVSGTRRVLLIPPQLTGSLYPFPAHLSPNLTHLSQVHPRSPDLDIFPRAREVRDHAHEVVLQPGEMLMIPAFWWHEVISGGTELACAFNRFWPSPEAHAARGRELVRSALRHERGDDELVAERIREEVAQGLVRASVTVKAGGEHLAEVLTQAQHLAQWWNETYTQGAPGRGRAEFSVMRRLGELRLEIERIDLRTIEWRIATQGEVLGWWDGSTVRMTIEPHGDEWSTLELVNDGLKGPDVSLAFARAVWKQSLQSLNRWLVGGDAHPVGRQFRSLEESS